MDLTRLESTAASMRLTGGVCNEQANLNESPDLICMTGGDAY